MLPICILNIVLDAGLPCLVYRFLLFHVHCQYLIPNFVNLNTFIIEVKKKIYWKKNVFLFV